MLAYLYDGLRSPFGRHAGALAPVRSDDLMAELLRAILARSPWKPEAFVVLREGAAPGDALSDELMKHCKSGLAPYKFPRLIHFVTELPKTATGKIQRFRLRQGADAPRSTRVGSR